MSTDYVYSLNNEDFHDWEYVVDIAESENEPGAVIDLYKGEPEPAKHADFISVSSLIESMQELAYCDGEDCADGYLNDLDGNKLFALRELIAEWFDKNAEPPKFYRVKNVVKESYIVREGEQ